MLIKNRSFEEIKKFKSNNPTIPLNELYEKEIEMCRANFSKYNSTREIQIILLMI